LGDSTSANAYQLAVLFIDHGSLPWNGALISVARVLSFLCNGTAMCHSDIDFFIQKKDIDFEFLAKAKCSVVTLCVILMPILNIW
jgi:hypothetical protein